MNQIFAVLLTLVTDFTDHETIQKMLDVNNSFRSQKLVISISLTEAAQDHAQYMADHETMSHYVNGSPGSRALKYGYPGGGVRENIAMGQPTVASVFATWRASPGHNTNLLSNSKYCGFGCAISRSGRYYWCGLYGN